ncbi:MAG: ParB/RepB/Spo0J family partition protein [Thermodesulfovibrio sp.]|nr:ParB/RepB/Spo0J family partition protein [Thermodesulfovibrio sp.]MDW7973482.1 ParB/RepB/Spo0J family partition protein [Thermodesulfovibrio sp.]
MAAKQLLFKDPYKGNELVFKLVSVDDLEVIPHQRKPSQYHVNHLIYSIERVGFLIPLIVVERENKKGKYWIIDGQHRYLAAKKLNIDTLPVIVVPPHFVTLMMNFNIEKELNIREKAHVGLSVYREILKKDPKKIESDPLIMDSIEKAYYITLGIAYEEAEKLAGSAFEPILKKCDFFLDEPVTEAYEIRKKRAKKLLFTNEILYSIASKIKEMGRWHPYVYAQILSWSNPYKRKRLPKEFDELFDELIENLRKAETQPELILSVLEEEID